MTLTYESPPEARRKCPKCGRRRWLTVEVEAKKRTGRCTCGHTWGEK